MKRFVCMAGLLVLLAAGVLATRSSGADDKKNPTIKDIMKKAHNTSNGLLKNITEELKADDTQWDEVRKDVKELVALVSYLGKNDPPKGDKSSWDQQTKAYLANAKALEAAAQKQDRKTSLASQKRLSDSCSSCHSKHRPR